MEQGTKNPLDEDSLPTVEGTVLAHRIRRHVRRPSSSLTPAGKVAMALALLAGACGLRGILGGEKQLRPVEIVVVCAITSAVCYGLCCVCAEIWADDVNVVVRLERFKVRSVLALIASSIAVNVLLQRSATHAIPVSIVIGVEALVLAMVLGTAFELARVRKSK